MNKQDLRAKEKSRVVMPGQDFRPVPPPSHRRSDSAQTAASRLDHRISLQQNGGSDSTAKAQATASRALAAQKGVLRPPTTTSAAFKKYDDLVASKMEAANPSLAKTTTTMTKNHSGSDEKAKSQVCRTKSTAYGSGGNTNNSQYQGKNNPAFPCPSSATDLDDRIAQKTQIFLGGKENADGKDSNKDLDDRIAQKTRVFLGEKEKNPGGKDSGMDKKYVSSKSTRPLGEGPNAGLEKNQYHPNGGGDRTSAIESKAGVQGFSGGTPRQGGNNTFLDVENHHHDGGNLAVAVAVQDEDNAFIPAAVEYDPDAKPPLYKNRRFRLYGLLACLLLVVVVGGIVGLLVQNQGEAHNMFEPSMPPTSVRYSLGIQEQLELVVGLEKINDPTTAHYKAKEWIINDDPMKLSPRDVNLVQRYLLAVIYYQTHQDGDWLSCNAPSDEDPGDSCMYKKLISAFPEEYMDVEWAKWLSGKHECTWAGIFCDEFNQLRGIDLLGQRLSGSLPPELANFPFLQSINLAWNKFNGTIPSEFGSIKHLLSLELHYNQLSGSFLADWSKAKNIQMMNLAANELTGTIPSSIMGLSNMKGLFLYENYLTGSVPSGISALSLLTYARLQGNFLDGTIPPDLFDLPLRELWMTNQQLTGSLPSEIGLCGPLGDLRLKGNLLNGSIPEEIYDLPSIWRLDLRDTELSGTISTKIGQLSTLAEFRISGTNVMGGLPTELGNLVALETIEIDQTRLSGSVPLEVCDLKENQALSDLVADCLPSLDSGIPEIHCECCSLCCNSVSGECEG